MPVYEFRCQRCGNHFDALVRSGGSTIACPACGAAQLEKQISAPAPLSRRERPGAGRTCCGLEERCKQPPCSADNRCRRD